MKHIVLMIVAGLSMVASAFMTKPILGPFGTETTRDLSKSEMSSAGGAGSSCQLGCNVTSDSPCVINWIDETHWNSVSKMEWYEKYECRFAWTGTCYNLGDTVCNRIKYYYLNDLYCAGPVWYEVTTETSTCNPTSPPDPPGEG